MAKILFLPGAGASPDFWKPVGALLPADWPKEYFGWPGLGDQPHDPAIKGIDDLVRMVAARMDGPVDLVAQSMGGIIAARLAIEQPQNVRRLVLTVTSGGVDMAGLGASDWREGYRKSFPARACLDHRAAGGRSCCRSRRSPRRRCCCGATAIRSARPPSAAISQSRIPDARLHIVAGGDHDLARTHAAEVAPLIARHLA